MPKPLRTLILDDSQSDSLLLLRELKRGGFDVDHLRVDNALALRAALEERSWDIVISDYHMPAFDALEALQIIKERDNDLPVILISGAVGEEIAVAAMKAGASDYFPKDKLARLIPAVEREVREAAGRRKRHEAEALFAAAFQANPVGTVISRVSDGAALDVNARFLEIFGYEREEVIGKRSSELGIWVDPAQREEYVRELYKTGSVRNAELAVRKRNGTLGYTLGYALVSAEVIQLSGETCVLTMVHDISERKAAEQALQRNTDRLELLHAIDRSILRAELPQTIAETVLTRMKVLMAYHSASVTTFDHTFRHFTVLATAPPLPSVLTPGRPVPIENRGMIELMQRNEIYLVNDLADADPISSTEIALLTAGIRSFVRLPLISNGKLLGSVNIHAAEPNAFSLRDLDIAREVAAQLAIAIENSRLLEVEVRRNKELTALHQASLQLTSTFELEKLLDSILDHAIRLIHAQDAHIFLYDGNKLTFGAALIEGKKLEKPYAEPRQNGLTYTVARTGERMVIHNVNQHAIYKEWQWGGAIIGLPLRVADEVNGVMSLAFGEPHHFDENEIRLLELLADQAAIAIHNAQLYQRISRHAQELEERVQERTRELRASEESLRVALAKERELGALKTHFVSMVSHDFRNPLTVIQSSANMLESFYDRLDQEKRTAQFTRIRTQIQRMVEILDDVLAFSRADAGASALHLTPVELHPFCQGIVDEFQNSEEMKHSLIYTHDEPAIALLIDESMLQQALINLLSNAFKYSPEGSSVYLDLSALDGHAVIRVKDSGIGIPLVDQPRLFEMFYRAANVGQIKGTGLGLPIVKRSVEAHGGSIEVSSAENQGTEFIIKLPLNQSA